MDEQQVMAKLSEISSNIFDDDSLTIDRNTSAEHVDAWDSLSHVNFIAAVEAEFDIQFTLSEIRSLQNVGEIADLVHELVNE